MKISIYRFSVVCLLLASVGAQKSAAAEMLSQVTGQLEAPTAADCRGMVALWPVSEFAVVPAGTVDDIPPWTAELAADCSFAVSAYPGSYYLQAILRKTAGHNLGPLRVGDLVFMAPDARGGLLQVALPAGQPVNVGTHASYWQYTGSAAPPTTGVAGRLVDTVGAPLAGLVVQAFGESDMSGRPLAISAPSDENGSYQLRLAGAAAFYLLARDAAGIGLPPLGHNFGVQGDKKAVLQQVAVGQLLTERDIVVRPRTAED